MERIWDYVFTLATITFVIALTYILLQYLAFEIFCRTFQISRQELRAKLRRFKRT